MDGIFLQLTANGIATGMLYAIVGLSLTMIFKATTIVNFGNGDFVMAGAFAMFVATQFGLPPVLAFFAAMLVMAAIGAFVHRVLLQPIMAEPHLLLSMMVMAIGFVLKGVARFFWGQTPQMLPRAYPNDIFEIGPVIVTYDEVALLGSVLILVGALICLFQLAPVGRAITAVFQTTRGAELVGIDVPRYQMAMWAAGSALGAWAGFLLASVNLLTPDMGVWTLLRGFAAMTLGGFGSIPGAVVGGLILGVMEKLLGFYLSTSFIDITAYLVTILVLVIRPSGLFGRPAAVRV